MMDQLPLSVSAVPWQHDQEGWVRSANGVALAFMSYVDPTLRFNNGVLMAAAPKMLALLQQLADPDPAPGTLSNLIWDVRRFIAGITDDPR